MAEPLVICVGNSARGDDGAGPAVAGMLNTVRPELDVRVSCGEPAELLELWADAGRVVVVDAIVSGLHPPGTVVSFDASSTMLPVSGQPSSHGMGLAEAVELGRSLGRLPDQLLVIGIEAEAIEPGTPLSASVAAAVPRAVDEALMLTHA